MLNCFDITDFGAVADGKTDCTQAIQAALNEAGKVQGRVIVPPGEYLCGYVHVPEHIMIQGTYAWSFAENGGSVLKLNDSEALCLLDITGAIGCCIDGICLDGGNLGEEVHGVLIRKEDRLQFVKKAVDGVEGQSGGEDTPTITNCRIGSFTGDAVRYEKVWCFTIRNSMLCYSRHGLYMEGCDCFITDTWFSYNREDGVHADFFMSGTFTGCRFECNHGNGVYMYDCGVVQFGNNYFDANEKHGFYAAGEEEDFRGNLNFNGNIFYRSGYDLSGKKREKDDSHSHISVAHATNIVINGNTFAGEKRCPAYGVTIRQLRSSVVANNTFMNASCIQNLVDLGGHKDEVVILNNTGLETLTMAGKSWPRFED